MEKIPADTLENKETVSCVLIPLILLTEQKKMCCLPPPPPPPPPPLVHLLLILFSGSVISSLFIIHELIAVSVCLF